MTGRREFLKLMGLGGATALSASSFAEVFAAAPGGSFLPAGAETRDRAAHAIARLTYGVTPALYSHLGAIGPEAFIEEQLAPDAIDDSALAAYLADYGELADNGGVLLKRYRPDRAPVARLLFGNVVLRAMFSQRQLYERMVEFWSDHFSIFIGKGPCLYLKIDDDRDAIRPHAMGRFRDLLGASAHSPAMLVFLDNAQSTADAPNENYGRELMELHTLSVDGGYTEDDVKAVAHAFTGWSVWRPEETADGSISYRFRRFFHDYNAKTVLGNALPANQGEQDGETVLDILASHPSTARFIAEKLCRRFVSDQPSDALVAEVARTFLYSDGDITSMLQTIFTSDEFWNAPPKFRRPFEYTIGSLRALNYDVTNDRPLLRTLQGALSAMGHIPFNWPAPNGYPDVESYWQNNLLMRWNVALAAAGGHVGGAQAQPETLVNLMTAHGVALEDGPVLDFLAQYLWGRPMSETERGIMLDFIAGAPGSSEQKLGAGIALLMASPAHQYR